MLNRLLSGYAMASVGNRGSKRKSLLVVILLLNLFGWSFTPKQDFFFNMVPVPMNDQPDAFLSINQ
jgi:prophage maintenance system killer protein